MGSEELLFRDGHSVRFVEQSFDGDGEFLRIEHRWPSVGRMAGPHWHPELTERFRVVRGSVRFRIDGRDHIATPGQTLTVGPRRVHQFWNEETGLVLDHEVRPPLCHRQMFELWHRLDFEGKTTRAGMPRNPLDLGLLWELQDGYLAKIPVTVQRAVLGGLARIARKRRNFGSRPRPS
ncbi:cupin domain-containing protein [Brevibacterium picturae]|uniref:Cupin type-2 domain-containing protein n=1 Tax=Brevibacterium picturae TaxID=260553 RepID=A0ABN2C061_9MICO